MVYMVTKLGFLLMVNVTARMAYIRIRHGIYKPFPVDWVVYDFEPHDLGHGPRLHPSRVATIAGAPNGSEVSFHIVSLLECNVIT